ncbi:hypothetical protein ZIOFF_002447 [Zingiber officinale]|uniref:Uncharacterized protein n=1 Tax=Zingiber officinale TaxID=94328 RepID=A0A8J5I7J0_ZINOF|nr:hypothetical protein ZIOFF_002447 [Zingiber officinale]
MTHGLSSQLAISIPSNLQCQTPFLIVENAKFCRCLDGLHHCSFDGGDATTLQLIDLASSFPLLHRSGTTAKLLLGRMMLACVCDEGNIQREEVLTMWNQSFTSNYHPGSLEHAMCLMLQSADLFFLWSHSRLQSSSRGHHSAAVPALASARRTLVVLDADRHRETAGSNFLSALASSLVAAFVRYSSGHDFLRCCPTVGRDILSIQQDAASNWSIPSVPPPILYSPRCALTNPASDIWGFGVYDTMLGMADSLGILFCFLEVFLQLLAYYVWECLSVLL